MTWTKAITEAAKIFGMVLLFGLAIVTWALVVVAPVVLFGPWAILWSALVFFATVVVLMKVSES